MRRRLLRFLIVWMVLVGFVFSFENENVYAQSTPVADFSTNVTSGKAPLTVFFSDKSTGSIDAWSWDFGDGGVSVEQNHAYTYLNEGFYTVEFKVSNSEGGDIVRKRNMIYVKSDGSLIAEFTASPNIGNSPLDVQFTDSSEGDVSSWLWSFGDGATSDEISPEHTYQHPGIYTVSLGVSSPVGVDSETKTNIIRVTETGHVEAGFTANKQIGILPLTVNLLDNSIGEIDSWLWDFGDGSTSVKQNPVHVYATPGNYTIKLSVIGPNNSDSETKNSFIQVIPDEEGSFAASFNYSPVIGFAPVQVQFYDQTIGVNTEPDSWEWDFGDEESSTDETPIHEYNVQQGDIEFDVTLAVTVGEKEKTFTIEDAVKVFSDTGCSCSAIMSVKPDPIRLDKHRFVRANIAISSCCIYTIEDIICDSIEMAGAHPVSCNIRRGLFVARFNVKDLDIESGSVDLLLSFETVDGDLITISDMVNVEN